MLNPATKSLRLKDFDYTTSGGYFITIRFLPKIEYIAPLHDLINKSFAALSSRYPGFIIDEWILMEDHLHFIFLLDNSLNTTALNAGEAIRSIKARVTHDMHAIDFKGFHWQPNYYDHIIRNERELNRFRSYIQNNPLAAAIRVGQVDG